MALRADVLQRALVLALLAGSTIPVGGLLEPSESIQPRWLEREPHPTVIAFGAGALLAAVSLVLAPEGVTALGPAEACGAFLLGGRLACAGGIPDLGFQDIAPQAHLERHRAPALGSVGGFALGLVGFVLTRRAAGRSPP